MHVIFVGPIRLSCFYFLPSATQQRQFHTPSKNQSTNLHANLKPIEKQPIYTQVKINFQVRSKFYFERRLLQPAGCNQR